MSIKIKGAFQKTDEENLSGLDAIMNQVSNLLPGHYTLFICDEKRNRSIGQLKYLFGVVLKMISAETGEEVNDLYRFFERKFAPCKSVTVNGEEIITQDLKSCSSAEFGTVIEKIVDIAEHDLGIIIPDQDQIRESIAQDIYVDAYNDQWTEKK